MNSPEEPHALAAPLGGSPVVVPSEDAPSEPLPPVSVGRATVVLTALAVAAFLIVSNEILPLGLISLMAEDLGRTESELGYLTTAFAAAVMLGTVPLAILTTRMIRRWVLVATLVLWSVGTLLAAVADTFTLLIAARVITGFGHALFWATVTPAAAGMFPKNIRGRQVARLMLGPAVAGVLGLPGASWLAQQTDWHVPYWILTAGGLLLAVVVAVLMPSFRTEQSTMARGDVPSMGRFWRIIAIVALMTGSMAVTWVYIAPFATDVSGFSDAQVPVLLAVGGGVGLVSMILVGRFLDRWPVKTAVIGVAAMLVMWIGLSFGGASQPVTVAMFALQGFAWSMCVASLINWALRHTPWPSDIGNGVYAAMFNAGNVGGSVAGAALIASWGTQYLPWVSGMLTAVALALAVTARPWARTRAL